MAKQEQASQEKQERDRKRWELLLLLLILLLSFLCLLLIAWIAVRPSATWQVQANMLSASDPEALYATVLESGDPFPPLRPEIMTRPPWTIETPSGTLVILPSLTPTRLSVADLTETPSGTPPDSPTPTTTTTPSTTPTPTT
ncbi:MAG TPA: hypothetical protein ENN19_00075, partial [Chloroflexi bacterium]|nr:hypothetical protein [Chloroflexota bacterium]